MGRIFAAIVLTLALLAPAGASAAWRRAESDNFEIYSHGSESELRTLAEQLERYRWVLATAGGIRFGKDVQRLTIYVLPDGEFDRLYGKGSKNIGGWYSVSPRGAYAVIEQQGDNRTATNEILFHEYAHHFMLSYFPVSYPAWLVEGFAEAASTAVIEKNGDVDLGFMSGGARYVLERKGVYPLAKLFSETTRTTKDMDNYYATSAILTHYLIIGRQRPDEFAAFQKAMKGGEAATPAAEKSFAGGLPSLEKDVRAYSARAKLPYTTYVKTGMPTPTVTITVVSPDAAERMPLEMIWMAGGGKAERRTDFLTLAGEQTTKRPADIVAAELLAEALYANERNDDAMKQVMSVLARDPDNVRALLLKAEMHSLDARKADDDAARSSALKLAREAILHANRVAVGDVRPLIYYYGYYRDSGRPPGKDAHDAIEAAFAVLPQDDTTRIFLTDSLAKRGRYDRAIDMLMPLVNSPHGDDSYARGLQKDYRCMAASGGKPCPPDNDPKQATKNK